MSYGEIILDQISCFLSYFNSLILATIDDSSLQQVFYVFVKCNFSFLSMFYIYLLEVYLRKKSPFSLIYLPTYLFIFIQLLVCTWETFYFVFTQHLVSFYNQLGFTLTSGTHKWVRNSSCSWEYSSVFNQTQTGLTSII